jgi:hypothetical protein
MFAAHDASVDVPFDVATSRLTHLINQGALHAPSEAAYEEGLTSVLRVGPGGSTRGLSKLVRVRWLEPIWRKDTMSVPMRWEATGASGELFPMLDADLIVARHGAEQVQLRLTGSYRPPFGAVGATLNRVVMHHIADATIRTLLTGIARSVSDPATQSATPQQSPSWQTVVNPEAL